ncbi:hypothetical protein [Ectobacillus panaciterrae]
MGARKDYFSDYLIDYDFEIYAGSAVIPYSHGCSLAYYHCIHHLEKDG